jgi:hypothetical protein
MQLLPRRRSGSLGGTIDIHPAILRSSSMAQRTSAVFRFAVLGSALTLLLLASTWEATAQETKPDKLAKPIDKGQRIFTCAHSFHQFVPAILSDLAQKAEIKDQVQVGLSSIGGSKVIQHWDVPEEKNKAKEALKSGKVDVLTLSPIYLPDAGIENFTKLALEHNKDIRVTVQEFWLRWDIYEPTTKRPEKVDHNAITGEELRKRHAPYFKSMDEHVQELNKKLGKTVLYVVPAGQAIIALREKVIADKAPGIKSQEDLFTDATGHVRQQIQVLVAYCHYAVIYRRNPVGLPVPTALRRSAKVTDDEEKLNRLLQELAWEAVTEHPLSGVRVP